MNRFNSLQHNDYAPPGMTRQLAWALVGWGVIVGTTLGALYLVTGTF